MEIQEEYRHKIRDVITSAITSALSPNKIKVVEADRNKSAWSETLLVSILGFQGEQMSGSVVLGCDEDFLRRTCPTLIDEEINPEKFIHDWIGELSNLIMGQIKNRLLSFGVLIRLNPPSISEATDLIFDTYSSRMPSETLWFVTEGGDSLRFLISCEIAPGFNFQVSKNGKSNSLTPGSGILSLKNFEVGSSTIDQKDKILSPKNSNFVNDLGNYSDEGHDFELPDESDFEDEHLSPICSIGTKEQDNALENTLVLESQSESAHQLGFQAKDSSIKAENLPPLAPNSMNVNQLNTKKNESNQQDNRFDREKSGLGLNSFSLNKDGMVELVFQQGIRFRLNPKVLLENDLNSFELQGLHVQVKSFQSEIVVNVGGLELIIGQKVA